MKEQERECYKELMRASPGNFFRLCQTGRLFVQKRTILPGQIVCFCQFEDMMKEDPDKFLDICESGGLFRQTWIDHSLKRRIQEGKFSFRAF